MKNMRYAVVLALLISALSIPLAGSKAPFTFDVMMKLARISDPQLSPDGKMVAFAVQSVDLAANTKPTQIYVVTVDGGTPRQLTQEGSQNSRPRWTPDSKRILFMSNRSSGKQIWSMAPDGSDARQVTALPTEAEGETVSPDGKMLLFTSLVYPGCAPNPATPGFEYDADCNKRNLDADMASKMRARVYMHLLYRHWTEYRDRRRSHLLVQPIEGGKPKDLTPGDLNVPPFSLGGPEAYVFSPDSTEITYVSNTDPDLATSTNSDLFTIPVAGGDSKTHYEQSGGRRRAFVLARWRITSPTVPRSVRDMKATCGGWLFSNARAESCRLLTENLDRWVDKYAWFPDSRFLFFTIQDHGHEPIMRIPVNGGPVLTIAQGKSSLMICSSLRTARR